MGCDIHPHIEVKIKGRWEHYSCPPIQRWYQLFAKICGVRNNPIWGITAISEPRGLPDDINIVTALCYELEDHHTPTWLSAAELDELIWWAEREMGQTMFQHKEVGYLTCNMFSNREPEFEDCRFICWFDN